MSTFPPPPPLSPGVGARRKGPKQLPRLPLSIFTPPNSGTSDKFPLLPSPSAIHPKKILDANVRVSNNDLQHWANDTELGTKTGGIVAILSSSDNVASIAEIASVAAVSIPLDLSDVNTPTIPPSINTHFTLAFQGNLLTDDQIRRLAAVVESGHSVDIDVQADFANGEAVWESLEDLLARATAKFQGSTRASFVISNVLPPPHSLDLPIVKLLSDPSYISYQSHISTVSLYPNVCVKFVAPTWGAPTPKFSKTEASKDTNEWKRRIRMFLGPAVEAFGYERIIFGSSPSSISKEPSNASDWYELARGSIAELGLEQEDIDNVFFENAKRVYNV